MHSLELVQNLQDSKSTDSLYGLLNSTHSAMGSRLLRTNILQPVAEVSTLENRLDALEEFTHHEDNVVCALLRVFDGIPNGYCNQLARQYQLVLQTV